MEREAKRELKRQQAAERAAEKLANPPNSKEARARRNAAFSRNVHKFNKDKAKYIAWIITQRQKGNFWSPSEAAKAKTACQRELGFID